MFLVRQNNKTTVAVSRFEAAQTWRQLDRLTVLPLCAVGIMET
jgi:hypothetical protein